MDVAYRPTPQTFASMLLFGTYVVYESIAIHSNNNNNKKKKNSNPVVRAAASTRVLEYYSSSKLLE